MPAFDLGALFALLASWLDSDQVLWPVIAVTATVALLVVSSFVVLLGVRLYQLENGVQHWDGLSPKSRAPRW